MRKLREKPEKLFASYLLHMTCFSTGHPAWLTGTATCLCCPASEEKILIAHGSPGKIPSSLINAASVYIWTLLFTEHCLHHKCLRARLSSEINNIYHIYHVEDLGNVIGKMLIIFMLVLNTFRYCLNRIVHSQDAHFCLRLFVGADLSGTDALAVVFVFLTKNCLCHFSYHGRVFLLGN